jgi:hypothetical protein
VARCCVYGREKAQCRSNRVEGEFVVAESLPKQTPRQRRELGRSDINMTTNRRGKINSKRSVDVMGTLQTHAVIHSV